MSIIVRKRFVEKEKKKVVTLQNFLWDIRRNILAIHVLNDKERERMIDIISDKIYKKLPQRLRT